MANQNVFFGIIPGGVELKDAGAGPAEIQFPLVSLAPPASNIYTIQTANVAQTLAAARTNRKGFVIQNFDADELWWEYATNPVPYQSFKVEPYAFFICPPTLWTGDIIKILGARAGIRFCFREAF